MKLRAQPQCALTPMTYTAARSVGSEDGPETSQEHGG